jgi:hypothetical protein
MEFRKYMHIERFGNDEVQGIELGGCYVFPKLDGSNGSVWLGDDLKVKSGSRNRELTVDNDNQGFCEYINNHEGIQGLFSMQGELRLFGEWLVPHSLRTYREDAWRRFYVFDVFDEINQTYMSYEEYQPILESHGIDYIPPICVMNNATYDNLLVEIENNTFLIQEGRGAGEGIVIKNYQFKNRFGRTVWAKMVTNAFKEKHVKTMGATVKNMKQLTEQVIVEDYVSKHLIDKVYAKIANENNGWNSKYIPRLLSTVYYDLVNEETWNIVKKFKNPAIDFKKLNQLTILKIKEIRPELF